jgi:hypothetical protein
VSNAGNDQTVEDGETVTLSGLNSTDPDDNIGGYSLATDRRKIGNPFKF